MGVSWVACPTPCQRLAVIQFSLRGFPMNSLSKNNLGTQVWCFIKVFFKIRQYFLVLVWVSLWIHMYMYEYTYLKTYIYKVVYSYIWIHHYLQRDPTGRQHTHTAMCNVCLAVCWHNLAMFCPLGVICEHILSA